MGTSFDDFMREVEEEARAEGPDAVAHLEQLREHYRMGRALFEARRRLKLSQKRVAQLAGIDQGDLSRIERGDANPTFTTLSAIAGAVGMEISIRKVKSVEVAKSFTKTDKRMGAVKRRRTPDAAVVIGKR